MGSCLLSRFYLIQRLGWDNKRTNIQANKTVITVCNVSAEVMAAVCDPTMAPTIAGGRAIFSGIPWLENLFLSEKQPMRLWTNMPMRLVPLATFAGSPMKIKRGRVSNDPLPANVLMKPARAPMKRAVAICRWSNLAPLPMSQKVDSQGMTHWWKVFITRNGKDDNFFPSVRVEGCLRHQGIVIKPRS